MKNVNFLGLQNLDLQWEWNHSRPFMYTHKTDYTSYTHYSQPLAHPLGANFDENLMVARYQPMKRLQLQTLLLQATYGSDSLGNHYGGNILLSYNSRGSDFGHKMARESPPSSGWYSYRPPTCWLTGYFST